ncbi:hypothetical protein GGI35DRAFT_485318 [Trichoderma velutinum]
MTTYFIHLACHFSVCRYTHQGVYHYSQDHLPSNTTCLTNLFFQIPPELFCVVIDNLGLHDEFVLSQTSRGLREIFSRDWEEEISRLPSTDRLRFWAGLASFFPCRWACLRCCRLHPIDESDTPNTPRNSPCGAELSLRGISLGGYCLQQNHIQNALKLSRMGNTHQKYLDSLMMPHKYSFRTEFMFGPPFTETYSAEPRIINGRFILQEEWVITDERNVIRPLNYHINIPGCPHLCIFGKGIINSKWWKRQGGRVARLANPNFRAILLLEKTIQKAIRYKGWIFCISCPRCPTDFEVIVSRNVRTATIRAWHDFGGEGAPMDTGWDVHVQNIGVSDWMYQGPWLGHVPGSIERLWLDSTSWWD